MAKFCGICGSKLEERSGLCPQCGDYDEFGDFGGKTPVKSPTRRQSGGKGGRTLAAVLVLLVVLGLVGAGALIALELTDTADIPVVEDLADSLTLLFHREHQWEPATCKDPKTCEICGETKGKPKAHKWIPADCVTPGRCKNCGETGEDALGHRWKDATRTAPKTCEVCAATEGDVLWVESVYINTLEYLEKEGKLWTGSEEKLDYPTHSSAKDLSVWSQEDIQGHTVGPVYDNQGNRYQYSLHLDGATTKVYYISYNLGGNYVKFTGWCGFPGTPLNSHAKSSRKCIYIYADDELVYITGEMGANEQPEYIEIDVTGVQVLRIEYPATMNNNEAATLFDGLLS